MRDRLLKRMLKREARAYSFLEQVREQKPFIRYLAAIACVALAFGLQYSFEPVFHNRVAFTFFVTSTLIAAWCGGVGPGIFAFVAGFMAADYFFLPPVGSFGKFGKVEWALLIGNAVPAILGIVLIELLHRARVRLAAHTRRLEEEVNQRLKAEEELRTAQQRLRDYALDLETAVYDRTRDLNEAVSFLERFCYTIAHDLRAPARALTGFVNILEEELPGPLSGDVQLAVQQIRSSARRMDRLILDLLDYGHISHVALHLERVPLQQAVTHALGNLQCIIDSTGAIVKAGPLGQEFFADAELLHRVLSLLLANALQFSKPNEPPRISIWSEERDGAPRLWIKDEGVGVASEYQEKIFVPFQTLSAPNSEHTGIGLAIVRKCMERMHGRVGVESKPGSGAAFWVELPWPASRRKQRPELEPPLAAA